MTETSTAPRFVPVGCYSPTVDLAKAFDESEHPRGKGGKFASKTGASASGETIASANGPAIVRGGETFDIDVTSKKRPTPDHHPIYRGMNRVGFVSPREVADDFNGKYAHPLHLARVGVERPKPSVGRRIAHYGARATGAAVGGAIGAAGGGIMGAAGGFGHGAMALFSQGAPALASAVAGGIPGGAVGALSGATAGAIKGAKIGSKIGGRIIPLTKADLLDGASSLTLMLKNDAIEMVMEKSVAELPETLETFGKLFAEATTPDLEIEKADGPIDFDVAIFLAKRDEVAVEVRKCLDGLVADLSKGLTDAVALPENQEAAIDEAVAKFEAGFAQLLEELDPEPQAPIAKAQPMFVNQSPSRMDFISVAKDGRKGRDGDGDGILNEGQPNGTQVSGVDRAALTTVGAVYGGMGGMVAGGKLGEKLGRKAGQSVAPGVQRQVSNQLTRAYDVARVNENARNNALHAAETAQEMLRSHVNNSPDKATAARLSRIDGKLAQVESNARVSEAAMRWNIAGEAKRIGSGIVNHLGDLGRKVGHVGGGVAGAVLGAGLVTYGLNALRNSSTSVSKSAIHFKPISA